MTFKEYKSLFRYISVYQMFISFKVNLDFDYASPNGKNIIMRISYFDALS